MIKRQGFARKWLIGGITAITATAGLVVGVTGSAYADPVTTLVGVGSDTTQDVMDAIAGTVGGGVIGSWDAVSPVDHSTAHERIAPKTGCTMTRPNGSGEGLQALRFSLGSTTATQGLLADLPEAGCVDFARSSSGPAQADASTNGALVYVPFAMDAVTTATGPATATANAVATNIVDADKFSKANLTTMYGSCTPVTPTGSTVSYVPDGTVTDATHQPIHLYIPQASSGTGKFWISTLLGTATLGSCVHAKAFNPATGTFTGADVQEHDGTVFSADADGIGPFSVAQFVAQRNGKNDRRHDANLHNIDGVSPCGSAAAPSSCLPSGTLNASFPIRREVYNIVSFARVTSTAAADAQFKKTFNGAASSICSNNGNILTFGFALLTSAPLGHHCGDIAPDLRAFDPLTDPV